MAPLLDFFSRGTPRPFRLNLLNRPKTEREQNRLIYRESEPALVIGIDVGMTFSGVSYALLLPGKEIEIAPVAFFQGQSPETSKVPTVLHYDQEGELLFCGAQTTDLDNATPDEMASHLRVEWFKLLLAPGYETGAQMPSRNVPDIILPPGKRPVDLWADFLRYLYDSLKTYIIERETNGQTLWEQTAPGAFFILSHPNGWEGPQHDQLKEAMVTAELIGSTPKQHDRITFVSEGEASFRWWGETEKKQPPPIDSHVVICDAGGGTIDVSSFIVTSSKPLQVKEATRSESRLSGSVFVTKAFRDYVKTRLSGSKFGRKEYIDSMEKKFDTHAKCSFEDPTQVQRIKFGFTTDEDTERGIKHGCFCVPGDRMAEFFQQSCDDAVAAIRKHLQDGRCSHVIIVGGFSGSNWLYGNVRNSVQDSEANVSRAKYTPGKPVAYGAVAYYLDRVVTSRIAQRTYGIRHDILSNAPSFIPWTWKRPGREDGNGSVWTTAGFRTIIQKGHSINDDYEVKESYEAAFGNKRSRTIRFSLYRYNGLQEEAKFIDMDSASSWEEVCAFSVEIPRSALTKCDGGDKSWKAQYDIALFLGQNEIRCYVEWQEKAKTRRTRAISLWKTT